MLPHTEESPMVVHHIKPENRTSIVVSGMLLVLFLTGCDLGNRASQLRIGTIEDLAWQGDNSLWVCGSEGTARLDIEDDETIRFGFRCGDILVAADGTVWASDSETVHSYDGQSWSSHVLPNGLATPVHGGLLLEAQDGGIWSGTAGLSRYDPATGSWQILVAPLPETPGDEFAFEVHPGSVYAFLEDDDGAIWIASNVGINRLNGASLQTWTAADGLACDSVRSLLRTRDGALLAGTDCGISRWDGEAWHTLPRAGSPDSDGNRITEILLEARDGAIWATTWQGVARWDGSAWQSWPLAAGLSHHGGISAMLEMQNGDIWVGTSGNGIGRWNGHTWRMYTIADGLADDRVQALLDAPGGGLVAATFGGRLSVYHSEADRWLPVFERPRE